MIASFLTGAAAGYAIAIPVGVIAVLIVETGMRQGLRVAFAAGAGAATADGLYATVAGLFGTALSGFIGPWSRPLRAVSVVVLVVIATRGLLALRSRATLERVDPPARSPRRTYLQLLGLTLLNPATVVYFAALILGLPALGTDPLERASFVAGVFLASLSWQSLLAAVGALAHRRLPARARGFTSLLGSLVVLAFALAIGQGVLEG